jgi:hypothetical protein
VEAIGCACVFDTGYAGCSREDECAVVGGFPQLGINGQATELLRDSWSVSICCESESGLEALTSDRAGATVPGGRKEYAQAIRRSAWTRRRLDLADAPSPGSDNRRRRRAHASLRKRVLRPTEAHPLSGATQCNHSVSVIVIAIATPRFS